MKSLDIALRVTGRIVAAGLIALVTLIAIGERGSLADLTASEALQMSLMAAAVVAFAVQCCPPWHHDRRAVLAAIVSLAATTAFYVVNFQNAGRLPGGWVFPLFFLPGLAELAAYLLRSSSVRGRMTRQGG